MNERRCPDCGVTMAGGEVVDHGTSAVRFRTEEPSEGFLGRFAKKTLPVNGYVCPECGLVRLYAEGE
ncbi:hypothetical protein [Natronorarus salvus]|uniref:hypothetical protein n=1 Tax=Natronorarus salvus TaxID=3117733 RepID=UPI002F26B416